MADDESEMINRTVLKVLEAAAARLVLLPPFANAKDLPITLAIPQ
jgi:hypothetical protein